MRDEWVRGGHPNKNEGGLASSTTKGMTSPLLWQVLREGRSINTKKRGKRDPALPPNTSELVNKNGQVVQLLAKGSLCIKPNTPSLPGPN